MNMDSASGRHAAKEALREFRQNPNVKPSNDSLVQLIEFVLTKFNFQFNGDHDLPLSTDRISVGTKTVLANANANLKKTLFTCIHSTIILEEIHVYRY